MPAPVAPARTSPARPSRDRTATLVALGTLAVALAALALVLAACGGRSGSPSPAASSATAGSAMPTATRVPGSASGPARPSASPDQTDTAWGRIWDALPPGFPTPPGASATELPEGAASGTFAVPLSARDAATWYRAGLERAGYGTLALSGPLEDGSFVIDSGGDEGCRVETTLAPRGTLTIATILFGAACPFR